MSETISSLLQKAERALERDETVVALLQLEAAHAIEPLPGVKAKLAYCLAKERRQYKQARALSAWRLFRSSPTTLPTITNSAASTF